MAQLKEPLRPWEKVSWNHEQTHAMFRDWARFYTKRERMDIAKQYNDRSLELRGNDAKALLQRSKCMRKIARPEDALRDSTKALNYAENKSVVNVEISDALYELNEFEICKMELHNNMNKYQNNSKVRSFVRRLDVINENFRDTLGDSLGPFFLKNERHFTNAIDHYKRKTDDQFTQSLWKLNLEQNKCDVQSVMDTEEIVLSPMETARRKRAYKVFAQIYFPSGWTDILFLKELCSNRNVLLPQAKASTPQLRDIMQKNYDTVTRSLKMLHARSPLYNENALRSKNKKLWQEHKEAYLNRTQYQTRRSSMAILRNVRLLRKQGNIEDLTAYVEGVMGDYIMLKTHRVMPWKYEFVHEVYNIMALAHADKYAIPKGLKAATKRNSVDPLMLLLQIPTEVFKDYTPFVFGDRSTYQERIDNESANSNYKKYTARLEKRIRFSKYCCERCYLLFEIARSHLLHRSFDDCSMACRRAVKEARLCGHSLWEFHCFMLILKFSVMLRKIERAKDMIREGKNILNRLKNPKLTNFIEKCNVFIAQQIDMKKQTVSLNAVDRRKRSRYSLTISQTSDDGSWRSGFTTRETSPISLLEPPGGVSTRSPIHQG